MKILDIYKLYKNYNENDIESIGKDIDTIVKQGSGYINDMAKVWEDIINFYNGKQHLIWDDIQKKYSPRVLTKYNKYIPRPVNDITFSTINTITSMLTRNRPEFKVAPVSDKPEDKNKAKVSNSIADAKYEMDDEFTNHVMASKICCMLGTVYRKDWWDSQAGKVVNGKTIGDNKVDIVNPFSFLPDYSKAIKDLDDGDYCGELKVMSVEAIKSMFNKEEEGYFPNNLEDLMPSENTDMRLDIEESLKGNNALNVKGERPENKETAVLVEFYIKPIQTNRSGLTIFLCNGKVLYARETIYTNDDMSNWHPYTMWRYHIDAFKHYGNGIGDVVVRINRRVNALDSLIELQRQTMATPKMLMPMGSVTPEQYPTGQPGQIIPFKPVNGLIPTILPASGLDPAVYRERESKFKDGQIYSGVNDIMNGNQPSGVNTATALQILLEQTNNNFSTILKSTAKFIEKAQTKKLNIIKKFYIEARLEFVNRVKALCKDTLTVEIDDFFKGEDLGDNVDIRVEGDSMMPKSSVVTQKAITDMISMQGYGDITPNNPLAHYKIMKALDVPVLDGALSSDIKRAEWENSAIRQGKIEQVVVLPTDNPLIHFSVVKNVIDDTEFQIQYNEQQQDNFWLHLLQHFVDMDDAQLQTARLNEGQIYSLQTKAKEKGIKSDYAVFQEQQLQELEAKQLMMQQQGIMQPESIVPAGSNASEAIAPDLAGAVGGDVLSSPVNSPSGMA